MNIALIAHDNKKELMAQFCTAYCGILAQHTLCATATTGQIISDATGLTIHRFLSFSWVWPAAIWIGATSSIPKPSPLPLDISLHIPYNRLRSNRYDGA